MRKKLKIAAIVVGALIVVLVGVFLYVNSGTFVKNHVLPAVADKLGEPVTVDDVSFSMFSHVELKGLKVGDAAKPLVQANTIRARFRAIPALSGKIVVDEVLVDKLVVDASAEQIAELQKRLASGEAPSQPTPPEPAGSPSTLQLDIRNVKVNDFSATYRDADMTAAVRSLNVDLPSFSLGQPFTLDVATGLAFKNAQADVSVSDLTVKVTGTIDNQMMPEDVKIEGQVKLKATSGDIALPELGYGFNVTAKPDGPAWQAHLDLASLGSGTPAEKVVVDGTLDPATKEGTVDLAVALSRPDLLNLAGKLAGDYDFGRTAVEYRAKIDLSEGGQAIGLDGKLAVNDLTIASKKLKLEPLAPVAIQSTHRATVNLSAKTASVKELEFTADQSGNRLVRAWLDRPASIGFGGAAPTATGDATLRIESKDLDLALVRPFVPASDAFTFLGGKLNDEISITARDGGKQIDVTGNVALSGLAAKVTGQDLKDIAVSSQFAVSAVPGDTPEISLSKLSANVRDASSSWLDVNLSQPMTVKLPKGEAPVMSPASLRIQSKGLDLAIAKPFIPANDAYDFRGGKLIDTIDIVVKDGGQEIALSGAVSLQDVAARVMEGELSGVRTQTEFAATVKLGKTIDANLTKLTTTAGDGSSTWASVALDKPLGIRLTDGKPEQTTPAEVSLRADGVALATFTRLVKLPEGLALTPGQLSYAIHAKVVNLGKTATVTGTTTLAGASVRQDKLDLANVGATTSFDVALNDMAKVTLRSLGATLTQNAATLAEVAASGDVDLKPLGGRIGIELKPVTKAGMALAGKLAGGIDLGATTPSYKGTVILGEQTVASEGALSVADLTARIPNVEMPPLAPMTVSATHSVTMHLDTQRLDLQKVDARVTDPNGMQIALGLDQPGTVDLKTQAAVGKPISLTVDVRGVDLSQFSAFAAAKAGLEKLAGRVTASVRAQVGTAGQPYVAGVTADLTDLSFHKPGTGTLQPISISTRLDARYAMESGLADLQKLDLKLSQLGTSLLDLQVSGQLDAKMTGRKTTIKIASTQPIDAGKLQALLVKDAAPAQAPAPAPAPAPQEEAPPPDWSKIWVVAEVSLARVIYQQFDVKNLAFQAEFKDGKLTVPDNVFFLNDSKTTWSAAADIRDPKVPVYQAKFATARLDLGLVEPYVGKFYPVPVEGTLTNVSTDVDGRGVDVKSLLDQLKLNLTANLDGLVVKQPTFDSKLSQVGGLVSGFLGGNDAAKVKLYSQYAAMAGEVSKALASDNKMDGILAANRVWLPLALESGIFPKYGMTWQDLRFDTGKLDLSFVQGLLKVPEANLVSPDFRAALNGEWNLADMGLPSLAFQPAVKGRLAPKGAGVEGGPTADAAGFYPGKTYDSGDLINRLLNKSSLTGMFSGSGDGSSDATEAAPADTKTKVIEGVLGGLLGGKEKTEETKATEEAPAEQQPEKSDKEKTKEAARDLIKGIFGK